MTMIAAQPTLAWTVAAELGEGPVWVERDRALWFVDIKKKLIHRFDPASGAKRSWESPEQVGFVLPSDDGRFVAGLQSGLYAFDQRNGGFDLLTRVEEDLPGNRLNDGVVDPSGRLWFGTMDDAEKSRSGAFYCYSRGKLTRTSIDGIAITNGPAVSPNGAILYFVDTAEGTIEAADISEDGSLSNRRAFARIDPADGHPDGPTIDREGCVWISLYGGSQARRYSPSGELVRTVEFPVTNITKIAFGGEGLGTAFATTARQLLSPDEIAKQPEIGDLFQFEAEVPGIPCPLVQL
jgi:D-xylonolactonase